MFDGFRPELQGWFFERRIMPSAITLGILLAGGAVYIAQLERKEETVEVGLADPELSDFAVEEEEEPEPEEEEAPEAEAPPPPPPNAKVKRVKKPTPRPKPSTPLEMPTEAAAETDQEKVYEIPEDGRTNRTGFGGGTGKSRSTSKTGDSKKPKARAAEKPKPKKKRKKKTPIDPTKPIDRPENATVPKPLASNAQPKYPKKLRDEGITGRVVLKLHVHRDGSVRGAKVLSKKTSATTEDEQKAAAGSFLKAVIKVVKGWKFKPATLEGKPISVWHKVNIPFELTD
ncbi:MAG: TonB family protein [Myxococcota bacterium]